MPVEILTAAELAVLEWMRRNLNRLADTEADGNAVLIIGKPENAEILIHALEDDYEGFRPLADHTTVTSAPPHTEIRVWGSLTA